MIEGIKRVSIEKIRAFEIENKQQKRQLLELKTKYEKLKQKTNVRSADWYEDIILLFIGNPFCGTAKGQRDKGGERIEYIYEKTVPGQATFRQIHKAFNIAYPPKTIKDKNESRKITHKIKKLLDRNEIKKIEPGIYCLTSYGKRVWKILDNINKANILLGDTEGIIFQFDPKEKTVTINMETHDLEFYRTLKNSFDQLAKKTGSGRPQLGVFFKGDRRISKELTTLLLSIINIYFQFKRQKKISKKSRTQLFAVVASDPGLSQIFGSFLGKT